ncbi:MAG TPA: substrate-binding domain-containing protein [Terriglobales bacterium]|nr:substrate-binding domain-containing protein [Terriglobales bacterium]
MDSKVTLQDIADALGLSLGTVHRAIHGQPGVNPMKKARVLQMAKTMGYRPNLAARYLRSKRSVVISINTPQEIASFYDPVRAGIDHEATPFKMAGVEIQHRMFPRLGIGEQEAFEAAIQAEVDGIIVVPGDLAALNPMIRRAARSRIPVVCLINDGPGTDKLSAVSVDTTASGALVAELMGRFLQGAGKIAVTSGDLEVPNHREKVDAFHSALRSLFPGMVVIDPIQNHESEVEAYEKTLAVLSAHNDINGLYVSTGNGAPVLRAVEDAGLMGKVTILSTNLFPALVPRIEAGHVVATIYERPYSQGRIAFRIMHDFLMDGQCPTMRVTLAPHLVMKSNLNRFLQHEYLGTESGHRAPDDAEQPEEFAGGHLLCY